MPPPRLSEDQAIRALTALGQETRLRVFRELVRRGTEGLTAGEIARQADVLPNTLSSNLAILVHAGLIRSAREGRSIRYFADFTGVQGMLAYLMEDCCGARPELCQPVLDRIGCDC